MIIILAAVLMTLTEMLANLHAALASRDDPAQARALLRTTAEAADEAWRSGTRTPGLAEFRGMTTRLLGDTPRAIAVYRDGLAMSPNDPALIAALEDIRPTIVMPEDPLLIAAIRPERSTPFYDVIPLRFQRGALVAVWSIGWLMLARWWIRRSPTLRILAIVTLMLAIIGEGWRMRESNRRATEFGVIGVVIAREGQILREGNAELYPAIVRTPLPPGTEGIILHERGGWLRVRLRGGAIGWLMRSAVYITGEHED